MNSDDLMPFGKHKFSRLSDVPADYFIEMFKSNHPKFAEYPDLKIYIEEQLMVAQRAKDEEKDLEERQKMAEQFQMKLLNLKPCAKASFITKSEAQKAIKRINGRLQRDKTPDRAYECSKCGYWHLTSLPFEEFIQKTNP